MIGNMDLTERLQELEKLELRERELVIQKEKLIVEIKKIRKKRSELLRFT